MFEMEICCGDSGSRTKLSDDHRICSSCGTRTKQRTKPVPKMNTAHSGRSSNKPRREDVEMPRVVYRRKKRGGPREVCTECSVRPLDKNGKCAVCDDED